MVERKDEGREKLLREDYHGQTAQIGWHELQTYYARGSVIIVARVLVRGIERRKETRAALFFGG